MGDVLTFTLRPKPAAPEIPEPLAGPALRASLEVAAQTALDAADRIIAVLDHMDGDLRQGGDEPSLASPESDQDCQAKAPETTPPGIAAEWAPAPVVLPWGGRGNVIAAAGMAILAMVGGG